MNKIKQSSKTDQEIGEKANRINIKNEKGTTTTHLTKNKKMIKRECCE